MPSARARSSPASAPDRYSTRSSSSVAMPFSVTTIGVSMREAVCRMAPSSASG